MPLSGIGLLFWVAGFSGHLLLLGVLFGRCRARQFPVFTTLICSDVLRTLVLFLVRRSGNLAAYLWAFLVLGFLDVALQFGVVYEVAAHVFRPLGRWAPDVRRGLTWLISGSLAVASVLTWMAAPSASRWEFNTLIKAGFFSSAMLSELFLGMVVLSVTVGLPWKTHVARIAQGLGAFSILDVLIEAGHTLYGGVYQAHVNEVLTSARQVLYLAVLGYWVVTLWQEAPEPRELPAEMREQLRSLATRLSYDLYTIRKWRKP